MKFVNRLKLSFFFHFPQVTQSMWLGASDRTSQLNLKALEEMFQMEEREKELAIGM